ncbi:MAG TPA: type II secretion system major pseudopilin GspG [Candidatus Sumerlaeota bacterium]|nr:type II secretion system major pseudopilin GspG [Candidatus Sumerlaeota bacterium]HPS01728.1 type II secretion system major pseudopilin GspG [Candidatus Sumerlaeota bacterium]
MRCSGRKRFFRQQGQFGFSFLEIMMVVMIIGILVAVVGPKILGKTDKARVQATKLQLKNIQTSLNDFEMTVGSLPTTDQGLDALVHRPSDIPEDQWERKMDEMPKDAWNESFVYRCPGEGEREYDLFSKGKDKKEGTEDDISAFKDDETKK